MHKEFFFIFFFDVSCFGVLVLLDINGASEGYLFSLLALLTENQTKALDLIRY